MIPDKLSCSLLLILLTVFTITKCDDGVHILSSFRQHVTSSTLKWLPIGHYDSSKEANLVVGGFQISKPTDGNYNDDATNKQQKMYVCRAIHKNGGWVAGTQLEGEKRCTVTFLGDVQIATQYELLENVERAARLSWTDWDKFHNVPMGAVAIDSMYIARHVVADDERNNAISSTHYIGTLDHSEKLGKIAYVKSDGEEGTATEGQVLVETDPIYYKLTNVKLNKWRTRINKNEQRIIGEATISNSRNERAKLAEAFGYKYKYFSYWGQGQAMIKALNTSITLFNKTKLPTIKWGMEERSEREDTYSVEIYLEPGTGVNVTVKANYTDYDVPYTGQLVSYYEDGQSTSREISGIRKEETISDIWTEFGPIYFLSNMSIVPTTVAPTTTRGTTGTVISSTSGSTTSTTHAVSDNNVPPPSPDDENMILPSRKNDNSNMQNDDGGPLSLKNKEESSAGNNLLSSLSISIATLLVSLYRIT